MPNRWQCSSALGMARSIDSSVKGAGVGLVMLTSLVIAFS
ncbi:Uncharacterised protein [Mycobacterium tuberculosis]|nr:Uncharacterised protein [Mycobacterium tuberculosis]